MSINWPRFVEIVKAHGRFLLVSHVRPDCDALGSELGMAGVLEALGKRATICNGQATPPNLAFIDPAKKIKAIGVDLQPADLADIEVIMVLDTSAWQQLGPMADVIRASPAKKLVLDHHQSEDDLGAELFKDVAAEATGRLVYDAAEKLGVKLSTEMARPIFAAVATDTGWFRFGSTSAGTMRCGAGLIEAGARPPEIYNALYEQMTLARLKLIGRTLANTVSERGGRLVHTRILQEDFAATGALPSDTEDVINMTLQVAGTEMAVILVEQPALGEQSGGAFKVSFRSRCAVDASKLAEQFGGGGHKAAAGATVRGTFAEAQTQVLDAVKAAMR
jgi:bifunctional oligoribonuclease and PAP phosphatase NrnA